MALSTADRDRLKNLLGARVTFERRERRLYGHDIAAMPSLVKPARRRHDARRGRPAGQAKRSSPSSCAGRAGRGVPLTPRGKGSSGYGGAIPVKKGVVVDLYRLRGVVAVDREAQTATVEPGITWEQLDRELAAGLTLRLYPTSYPSSSVGGWLAQGGAGIGSYEYGWFAENVVAARVVLAGGDVRELSGAELGLVADAEGTTGIISRVTLRVRQLEPEAVTAVAARTPASCRR